MIHHIYHEKIINQEQKDLKRNNLHHEIHQRKLHFIIVQKPFICRKNDQSVRTEKSSHQIHHKIVILILLSGFKHRIIGIEIVTEMFLDHQSKKCI